MDDRQALIQNLADAGCDAALSRRFMTLLDRRQTRESLALLARHRRTLLDRCHAEERKISCLDYLIHQLEQTRPAPSGEKRRKTHE